MTIRNEVFSKGVCVSAEIIDLKAGTIAFEEQGVVTLSRALTPDEVTAYTPVAPGVPVDERLAKLEAENSALRKALVKATVITDAAIDAEKVAVLAEEVAVK